MKPPRNNLRYRLLLNVLIIFFSAAQFWLLLEKDTTPSETVPIEHTSSSLLSSSSRSPSFDDNGITHSEAKQNCSSLECFISTAAADIARVWKQKNIRSWCISPANNINATRHSQQPSQGLLLVKVPKSASSTATGVVLRIADTHQCVDAVQWRHVKAAAAYSDRSPDKSFMLAPIRDASSRALSSVYFHHVSFHRRKGSNQVPKDPFILNALRKKEDPNFILEYTRLKTEPSILISSLSDTNKNDHDNITAAQLTEYLKRLRMIVEATVQGYDFFLVVERLQESLVVLAWLTGVSLSEVVTMSSKKSGSWRLAGKECIALVKPVRSSAVDDYFASPTWQLANAGDLLLHRAAQISLDKTIDSSMGRKRFERDLAELQRLQQIADTACANQTNYPCSAAGQPQLDLSQQSCYTRDFGCGYRCLDRLSSQYI